MAKEAVVGVLRAILTADTAQFDASMKRSAQKVTAFGEETTRAVANIAKSLSGERIVKQAQDTATAINLIGGASKLTALEASRLSPVFTEALAKLKAMGLEGTPEAQKLRQALSDVNAQAVRTSTVMPTMTGRIKEMALGYATGVLSVQAFLGAGRKIIDFIGDSIGEYLEAEKVQKQLTAALTAQGLAIPAVLTQFDALANKYQRLTLNSDEAIKETQALLVQIGGVLPSEMDKALEAVTNLSAGMGSDLRAATMMVSKAFEDNFGALKKAGVTIDEARAKSEGMVYVLGQIQARFSGQAAAEIDSYSGKIAQLTNEWHNFQEELGRSLATTGAMDLAIVGLRLALIKLNIELMTAAIWLKAMPTPMEAIVNPAKAATDWVLRAQAGLIAWSESMRKAKLEAAGFSNMAASKFGEPAGMFAIGHSSTASLEAEIQRQRRLDEAKAKAAKDLEANQKKAAEAAKRLEEANLRELRSFIDLNIAIDKLANDFMVSLRDNTLSTIPLMLKLGESLEDVADAGKGVQKLNILKPPAGMPPGAFDAGVVLPKIADPTELSKLGQAVKGQLKSAALAFPQFLANAIIHGQGLGQALRGLAVQLGGEIGANIGKSLDKLTAGAGGFLGKLSGAFTGMLGAGVSVLIDLAIKGITKLVEHFGGNQTKKAREGLASSLGFASLGALYDELAAMGTQGDRLANMGRNLIGRNDQAANKKWMEEVTKFLKDFDAALDKGLTSLSELGSRAPNALQPLIATLLQSTKLTAEQRLLLEGLTGAPGWEEMEEAATRYGIALDGLGATFQQNKLGSQFDQIFTDFTNLTEGGADAGAVLTGMADEVQALLTNALKFGSKLPEFMRPMLEQMAKMGLLTDEAGNALTDLSRFTFTASIESSFERMADILREIADLLRFGLPQAASDGAVKFPGKLIGEDGGRGSGPRMPGSQPNMEYLLNSVPNWQAMAAEYSGAVPAGGYGSVSIYAIDALSFEQFLRTRGGAEAITRTLPQTLERWGHA